MTNTPLSEAAIKDIVEGMPDGLNGFTKHWGWLQFARKIEAAHGITQQTTMPTPSTIKAGQRLLINLPSSGLTEIKVIEINGAFAKAEVSNEMRWERIERIQSSVVHVLEEPKPRQSMADAVRKANHADALQRLIQLGDLEMSPEGRALYERDRDEAKKNFLYGPRHSTYKKDQDNITRKVRFAYEGIEELPTYTTNTSK